MKTKAGLTITTLIFAVGILSPAASQEGDAAAGKKVFKSCSACHSIGEKAKNRTGPVLNGVIGRQAGSFEGYKYGPGLKAANERGLVWSKEEIFKWLESPKDYIRAYLDDPKARAKMSFKLKNDKQRRDVIEYLATQG